MLPLLRYARDVAAMRVTLLAVARGAARHDIEREYGTGYYRIQKNGWYSNRTQWRCMPSRLI